MYAGNPIWYVLFLIVSNVPGIMTSMKLAIETVLLANCTASSEFKPQRKEESTFRQNKPVGFFPLDL